jgi:hypothetical protein
MSRTYDNPCLYCGRLDTSWVLEENRFCGSNCEHKYIEKQKLKKRIKEIQTNQINIMKTLDDITKKLESIEQKL